jgi:hypothetical protein
MLSGTTWRAAEIAGTAVLRMVVSSDSMKKATATSQGNKRLLATEWPGLEAISLDVLDGVIGRLDHATGRESQARSSAMKVKLEK